MIEEQIPRKIAETGLKMKRKVKDSVFTKLFAFLLCTYLGRIFKQAKN